MAPASLGIDRQRLGDLCVRHRIRRLALFGSASRDELRADSDIDLLVEFLPGTTARLRFITIQDELATLLGREVDLCTPDFPSPPFPERVLEEAVPLYEAA